MKKRTLSNWFSRHLIITLIFAIAISFYFQFRIFSGIETDLHQQRLRDLGQITRILVAEKMPEILNSSTECKRLCEKLALKTRKRITISLADGKILGDSLSDTNSFPYQSKFNTDFNSFNDPVFGRKVLIHSILVDSSKSKEKVRLHLSMPLTGGWGTKRYFIQNFALGISLIFLLIFLSSKFVSQKIGASFQKLIHSNQKSQTNQIDEPISRSDFQEIQILNTSIQKLAKKANKNKQKLGENRTRLQAIFKSMHEGILALNHDHEILEINDAAKNFLGIAKEKEVVNKSLLEVFRSAELNTFLVALEDTGEYHETEIDISLISGEINSYHVSGILVQFRPHKPHGLLLVFNDITRIKKLEKMRQEFISNVSHELKTPVTSIKGLSETVSGCLLDDPEMAKRFLEKIHKNTERLNAIIDDLFQLSSLEQGHPQIEADFQMLNLGTTIKNALSTEEDNIRHKKIICRTNIEEISLFANHRLLEQAIANLIDNAVKYSPEGTEVEVTGKKDKDDTYKITVIDKGKGIPLEHQDRIFERFYRVDKSRDRQTGGSGLGLAIVKHIAQLHNGKISLESHPGSGSCFTISLPLEKIPLEI